MRQVGAVAEQNTCSQNWGDRRQQFRWVNNIEYRWGEKERKRQTLHVVVCEERWEEIDPHTAKPVEKTSRHAWISSEIVRKISGFFAYGRGAGRGRPGRFDAIGR